MEYIVEIRMVCGVITLDMLPERGSSGGAAVEKKSHRKKPQSKDRILKSMNTTWHGQIILFNLR